jgi:hypothetical protein
VRSEQKKIETDFTFWFLSTLAVLSGLVLALTTTADPLQNIRWPWSTRFVSDRNSALVKLIRLKARTQQSPPLETLIVGSSTSEVFGPRLVKEVLGQEAFLAGDGGSPTLLRAAYIFAALESQIQPENRLRQVIYVSDLFEARGDTRPKENNQTLDTKVYYQPELMGYIPDEFKNNLKAPAFFTRWQDFFSEKSLRLSLATLRDLRLHQAGKYKSRFHMDGSTDKTMLDTNFQEKIETRVQRTIQSYQPILGAMNDLNPQFWDVLKAVAKACQKKGVALTVILPPWHPLFMKHFREVWKKENLRETWRQGVLALSKSNDHVRVLDLSDGQKSGPIGEPAGEPADGNDWHDGVHFGPQIAGAILKQVKSLDSAKN